ncbi:MAG: hypothetical protein ACO3QV_08035 [Candidatus Nanopelagicaceae bacterium]
MKNFRSHILNEAALGKACEILSSRTNPLWNLNRDEWSENSNGIILRMLDSWSVYGRGQEELRGPLRTMEDIFKCPNRGAWSKTKSGETIYRGVWRRYSKLNEMDIRLTNSKLLNITGVDSKMLWIYGTAFYKSEIPMHSWSKDLHQASVFAGGAHVRRPHDLSTTVRMVMKHKVTDPSITLDLDSVSMNLENSGEQEVIDHSKNMKVDFAIRMADFIPGIRKNIEGWKQASPTKPEIGALKAISNLIGDENAAVLAKNKDFIKLMQMEKIPL